MPIVVTHGYIQNVLSLFKYRLDFSSVWDSGSHCTCCNCDMPYNNYIYMRDNNWNSWHCITFYCIMVLFMLGLWLNIRELKKTQLRPAWFIHVHLHNAAYRGHFNNNNNKKIYILWALFSIWCQFYKRHKSWFGATLPVIF